MSIIRRTLLIFLVLFSLSSVAHGAYRTHPGTIRTSVEPGARPVPQGPGDWPDNGEPDGGGNAKTNNGSSSEPIPDLRDDLVGIIYWFGKVLMARNLGIGL